MNTKVYLDLQIDKGACQRYTDLSGRLTVTLDRISIITDRQARLVIQ